MRHTCGIDHREIASCLGGLLKIEGQRGLLFVARDVSVFQRGAGNLLRVAVGILIDEGNLFAGGEALLAVGIEGASGGR